MTNWLMYFLNMPRVLEIPIPAGEGRTLRLRYYLEIHHEGYYAELGYYRLFREVIANDEKEILCRVSGLVTDNDMYLAIAKLKNYLKEKNYLRYGSVSD
jgi:hypothetical protein